MATDMKKLADDWITAWNSHDPPKIVAWYTDDCLCEAVGALGSVSRGKGELLKYLETLASNYPDFRVEPKTAFYSGNSVCGEFVVSGTQVKSSNPAIPATGKRFSVRGAYVSEWQNGKVKRHTMYEDYLTVMQQLGPMPPMPAK